MDPSFSIIVSFSKNKRGIGFNNQIPWNIPSNSEHFHNITCSTNDFRKRNAVIMGKKTFDSISEQEKPLPERLNIVLSKNLQKQESKHLIVVSSLQDAFLKIQKRSDIENIFVIGGESVFKEAIGLPNCRKIFVTMVDDSVYHFDCFFPIIPDSFIFKYMSPLNTENQFHFRFLEYEKK